MNCAFLRYQLIEDLLNNFQSLSDINERLGFLILEYPLRCKSAFYWRYPLWNYHENKFL